ncbi:heme-degrading domain-containing protein [Streptomyces sp. WI04-05B]|uniref:heme-degrading domain-containing protein n=1 Tax=Streptomyces TaxID=1883 RepID=UPI0029B1536D|nr:MULTISPECIES: heme-degrading domain-containing protein [unclassified Streptomyces]MDX2543780.1 heme-degrading domain-containing protein [Streptomyces sp. WI04-05B]MDX2582130.1 heme-degrading domain-containing protein [Streptomyces sp. WI04-05A]MDX3752544.1 heme-degrading domain-containing protein [Streptomyces sp. AK08-02]
MTSQKTGQHLGHKATGQPSLGPRIAPELTPSLDELEAQQRHLVFRQFTHEDAWALGSLLVELARERQAPVAVDIHRAGQQLFHAALPGSTPDNDAWIDRKRRVVERYGASSYLVGARFRAKGTTFEDDSRLDPDTYAAHGGSFPITVEGVGVIGSVTVSGLPQLQDHRMVVEALEIFLKV